MFANIGPTELILILLIVFVLFGAKKVPELGRGLGRTVREFRNAVREGEKEPGAASPVDHHTGTPPSDGGTP